MCSIKSLDGFESLIDLVMYFNSERKCLDYLEQWIWKGDLRCPHCGFDKPYRFKDGVRFKCRSCKSAFTAKIGTIFEKSRIPLVKWFSAMYLMVNNSKGMSVPNMMKQIGIKRYATVWFMMHRIREAMKQEDVKLDGVVSSDEAFVGGKNQNRHKVKRKAYSAGRNFKDKVPVLGLMSDTGKVKALVMPSIASKEIRHRVIMNVEHGSTLVTDEYSAYKKMAKFYNHQVVRHYLGEYKNKNGFSSNNIEGFWSHLKRMIIGVFHKVSPKYLQRYCDELIFRFNAREMKSGDRFTLLLSNTNNRLTYKILKKYASC